MRFRGWKVLSRMEVSRFSQRFGSVPLCFAAAEAQADIRVRDCPRRIAANTSRRQRLSIIGSFLPGEQITAHSNLPGFQSHSWPVLCGHKILQLVF